ncbi:hypothetical protein [Psychrobacter sp. Ps3]|uniref:hypothetical protein n=2 Tax=Gammaproteobacteria TaxID=1236 RepID=UPI001EDF805F|nr:hypothetical protein [Psychrobacter sp. Ps3]MCG3881208.1 hypothetical protein [Psychrobacter sp. Ps3]
MNAYTEYQIKNFYEKYESQTFDQDDVSLFITASRDDTNRGSIFRELGDFIAHPNLKTHGLSIKNLKPALKYFEENTDDMLDGKRPTIEVPFSIGFNNEILDELYSVFGMVEIYPSSRHIHSPSFREFMFCLIFLLGNFKLELNKKTCPLVVTFSGALSLTVLYPSDKYPKYLAEFTLAFLGNVYTGGLPSFYKKKLDGHIVRRLFDGSLAAIPYEFDKDCYLIGEEPFPKGVGLPLERKLKL